ncbi:N-acetyltransferase [Actinoplanes sp. OR16]|uniref:GNAT family N-acetyltransferase n=1 Tax=Actinoplanes sp. OR16 TaxID=946334 RepID=UPI000F6F121D|nr:N-acetyltransferase [Actinoplanes sp. OR16]BBH64007.1 N-acetyltransferase [Actinoplanes sp. OR16]
MIVEREQPGQEAEIHAVTLAAFGRRAEADLVDRLRTDPGWIPELSLVARQIGQGDARAGGQIVGHVVCSRGAIDGKPALGLGPLSVHPDHQKRGVGSALMHAVLGAADALGEPVVILLGNPAYYHRFGFTLADESGITAPVPEWAPYFQARPLTNYRPSLRGGFTYAAPFDDIPA